MIGAVTRDTAQLVGGFRLAASTTARNAIPNGLRREGMAVYTVADQRTWQLLPAGTGWTGTDNDWVPFGAIPPYSAATLTDFWIDAKGPYQASGTTISGSVTFQWRTLNGESIADGGVTLRDVTANVTLASGLSMTDSFSGLHTLTLPSSVTHTAGQSHTWRVLATDTKGGTLSLDYVVNWLALSSQTYYVRPDGSDSHNGLTDSAGGGWLSLQHAADTAAAGDVVHIRAGTYAGFALFGANQGCQGHSIQFLADSGVVINVANPHTPDGINTDGQHYVTVDGFTVQNDDASVSRCGIRMSGSVSIYGNTCTNNTVTASGRFGVFGGHQCDSLVQGNTVHDIDDLGGNLTGHAYYWSNALHNATLRLNLCHDIKGTPYHFNGDIGSGGSGVAEGCLIERNVAYNCNTAHSGGAINNDGMRNSRIQNNLFYGCNSAGIALYQIDAAFPSTGNVICNNTVILNANAVSAGKAGIRLSGGATGNTVFNNIVYPGGSGGRSIFFSDDSLSGTVCDYNAVLGTGNQFFTDDADGNENNYTLAGWQSTTGLDAHSFVSTETAVFTDHAGNDFTLSKSSTARDVGVATFNSIAAPSGDLNGTARPIGGVYDAGCYEAPLVPRITSRSPAANASNVAGNATVSFTFNEHISSGLSFVLKDSGNNTVAGSLNSTGNPEYIFTPTSSLTDTEYSVHVTGATDAGGQTMVDDVWDFFTAALPEDLFISKSGDFFNAGVWNQGNTNAVERVYGVQFSPTVNGTITAIKFARNNDSASTHTVYLCRKSGGSVTTLATKTSSGETGNGATQTVTLDSPISVSPGDVLAALVHSTAAWPTFALVSDNDGTDWFFAHHDPWTNNSGHLSAAGNPTGINGIIYAGSVPPANWSSFTVQNFDNYGVDVTFLAG